MISEKMQVEMNKFLGFYQEVHDALDDVATQYNSIVHMGSEFTWTEEMRLDTVEAVAILEDWKAKLHRQYLEGAIIQARVDLVKWKAELGELDADNV